MSGDSLAGCNQPPSIDYLDNDEARLRAMQQAKPLRVPEIPLMTFRGRVIDDMSREEAVAALKVAVEAWYWDRP